MTARQIPKVTMEAVVEQLRQAEPNILVALVLNGSSDTGLAMTIWTALEGVEAEDQALGLVQYALDAPPIEQGWEGT